MDGPCTISLISPAPTSNVSRLSVQFITYPPLNRLKRFEDNRDRLTQDRDAAIAR